MVAAHPEDRRVRTGDRRGRSVLEPSLVQQELMHGALREECLRHITDTRLTIADLALKAALEGEEMDQIALARALESPYQRIREPAARNVDNAAALVKFLRSDRATLNERRTALRRLGQVGERSDTGYLEECLASLEGNRIYELDAYFALDPKGAFRLAFRVWKEDLGDDEFRLAALRLLSKSDDPRRVDAFRTALTSGNTNEIKEVLETVRDQYLIELGDLALQQLRNPDNGIRAVATQAIERLKFYADAKKAFGS